MSIMNARSGAYMRATAGGTDRKKSSNYGGRKSNSTKTQKSGSKTQKKSTKSSTGYDNRSNAASGNANRNSNKKTTQKTGLEALIDRKDELKNIPAGDGSGRNQYQVEMNKFKSTPGGKKIFKKRFPNPLLKIAQGLGNYVRQGGALGILANALGGGKKAATGFGKDASTMASDIGGALGKLFGLDALQNKNIDIASGGTNADFNKVIRGQQAYDPSGLEGYKDKIYRDFLNQGRQNSLDPYGVPNPAFGTDQFDPVAYNDMLIEDQLQKENEARRNTFGDDKEAIEQSLIPGGPRYQSLIPGEINLSTINDLVNLRTNDEDIFEDVSETDYTGVDPNSFPEGGVPGKAVTQAGQELVFSDGSPVTEQVDTGLTMVGDKVFPNSPGSQEALDILNSNADPYFSGYPTMGFANGGYMSSFPNQNLNTESLSASDNIDDRIMKNLEFEKMSPGMMGYNQGGKVMSTYDKLKAIADNNYG
jgi:hypothetical protein